MNTIIVIGLGSMGRRRIRLMRALNNANLKIIGVDISPMRRKTVAEEFGITTEENIVLAVGKYNPSIAFVCTSPASHEKIVLQCIEYGMHIFSEINLLSSWYDKAIGKAVKKNVKLFMSSTFLYRKEIEYIINAATNDTVNYIYHSGQYLPDWHPWESYKDFFVSNKKTNACREILAIELPWIVRAFGEIESMHVLKGKNSSLDIDFNDNYMIAIKHEKGNKGIFCQDIISRNGLRRLEMYSERQHLFWDGTPQSLLEYDITNKELVNVKLYKNFEQLSDYNANIVEDAYKEEVKEFFEFLTGHVAPRYSFAEDKKILELIDGIENGAYG